MISNLSAVLAQVIKDEASFAEAESLYSECFKSEVFTVADGFYSREELVAFLCEDVCEIVNYSEIPDWYEPAVIKQGWSVEKAEALVDSLEFVELCNYKGEGEGFTLACKAAYLRQYRGKYNYA